MERVKCANVVEYKVLKNRLIKEGLFLSEMPSQLILLHLSDDSELPPIGIKPIMEDNPNLAMCCRLTETAREMSAIGSSRKEGITLKPIFDKDYFVVGAPVQVRGKDSCNVDFNETCLIKKVSDTEMNVIYVTGRGVVTEARIHLKDVESNKTRITLL